MNQAKSGTSPDYNKEAIESSCHIAIRDHAKRTDRKNQLVVNRKPSLNINKTINVSISQVNYGNHRNLQKFKNFSKRDQNRHYIHVSMKEWVATYSRFTLNVPTRISINSIGAIRRFEAHIIELLSKTRNKIENLLVKKHSNLNVPTILFDKIFVILYR